MYHFRKSNQMTAPLMWRTEMQVANLLMRNITHLDNKDGTDLHGAPESWMLAIGRDAHAGGRWGHRGPQPAANRLIYIERKYM